MNDPIANFVRDIILRTAKELPSCSEDIYQSDKWAEYSLEILEDLCSNLDLYDSFEE